jgi:hypothetical protein
MTDLQFDFGYLAGRLLWSMFWSWVILFVLTSDLEGARHD